MGYTHYFEQTGGTIPQDKWDELLEAVGPILRDHAEIICCNYDEPEGSPIADENEIIFNGKGEDGHETFVLTREASGEFEFCKTDHKPYDKVVVEVLQQVNKICPEYYNLDSDGGSDIFQ